MSKIARLPIIVPHGVDINIVDTFIKIQSGSSVLLYPFKTTEIITIIVFLF